MRLFHTLPFLMALFLAAQTVEGQRVHRVLLTKRNFEIAGPVPSEPRTVSLDPVTGAPNLYDPHPRIEVADADAGEYLFVWVGQDGEEKAITYQRPDALDVVVSGIVTRMEGGEFRYEYTVGNKHWSGQPLITFAVQTFSTDVKPRALTGAVPGFMSPRISEFSIGRWVYFGITRNAMVEPGESIKFDLTSAALPSLVKCVAHGGRRGIKGIGEEMPHELDARLLGYEAWPSGYTIAPSTEPLTIKQSLSQIEHSVELGWLSASLLPWYQAALSDGVSSEELAIIENHVTAGQATTEVMALALGIQHVGQAQ